jgi:hypothetical protein
MRNAYAKTGLMLMEGVEEYYDPADIAEWKAAIEEYFRLEGRAKDTDPAVRLRRLSVEQQLTTR